MGLNERHLVVENTNASRLFLDVTPALRLKGCATAQREHCLQRSHQALDFLQTFDTTDCPMRAAVARPSFPGDDSAVPGLPRSVAASGSTRARDFKFESFRAGASFEPGPPILNSLTAAFQKSSSCLERGPGTVGRHDRIKFDKYVMHPAATDDTPQCGEGFESALIYSFQASFSQRAACLA